MNHVHLVLDCARLRAVANAKESLPVVGAAWNAQDVSPEAGGGARHLRKFDVVTDRDGQHPEFRLEHPEPSRRLHEPVFALEARHVQLALDAVVTTRTEDERA